MKKRYNKIDFIRGLAIINMVIYHLCFDLVYLFNVDIPFFYSIYGKAWQDLIAITFIITSGISYNFGNKNKKKIIYLVVCALALSLYTYFFMKNEFIVFGIIHFFALATILLTIFNKPLNKVNKYIGSIISIILFISTKFIADGYIGILDFKYGIPRVLYNFKFLFWLGFPSDSFTSGDYYPLIPWFFLFLFGFYIGKIYLSQKPKSKTKSKNPITFMGRHSLLIYMLHQPIIYLILSLILKK